nr:MAG TPA: hypothetical protein [Caudoviricetes sp.]
MLSFNFCTHLISLPPIVILWQISYNQSTGLHAEYKGKEKIICEDIQCLLMAIAMS